MLENLPAVVEHLSEYISHEADLGRREKAQGLFDALSHPLFKLTAAFFCDVFAVVCATSKKVQATRGARVAAVQGLMNVMCTHLLHTMRHVIPGGWEESLGVDVGSSVIKGSRMNVLRSLIEDLQTGFKRAEWDGSANLEDWVEASSCSCERVFSYVTPTDFGQTTERMCETLWVRCNGEAPEDWGPFEVLEDLRKTPFRPRKRKQGHAVEVEDVVGLGLRLSRIWQFLWKRMVRRRFRWTFEICGLSPRGRHVTPTLAMCMGLSWRVRTKTVRTRIWSRQMQLPVAPLLTFVTRQLSPPPPLTVPRSWCFSMMWMRRC